MMELLNRYATGPMLILSKHHPLGNERHTICCGLTYILWIAYILGEKDLSQKLIQKEYDELGKAVSLMLRMCRPIFRTGKDVVLDSGFCVSKGIKEIETKGVYVGDLTKKQCYQPKGVPGDIIDTQSQYKEVGDVRILEARTQDTKLL